MCAERAYKNWDSWYQPHPPIKRIFTLQHWYHRPMNIYCHEIQANNIIFCNILTCKPSILDSLVLKYAKTIELSIWRPQFNENNPCCTCCHYGGKNHRRDDTILGRDDPWIWPLTHFPRPIGRKLNGRRSSAGSPSGRGFFLFLYRRK